jgi:FtsP/CotA-like multicopper oxidase with cupredoxin domain
MRSLLKLLLALVCLVVVAVASFAGYLAWSFATASVDTIGEVDFDRPLRIPPLAESRVDGQGRRVFDLTLQRGETDLGREEPTPTWGVNGSYLGPTVRATRGEEVLMQVTNELGEETSLHWHGMHLPARMDGGPHQPIAAGETWSPRWTIDQPASTLWYHPHLHGETAEHVYRGIAGLFLVDDPAGAPDLPDEYGVDDVPLIVQDKQFDGSELDTSHGLFESSGILGDTVLVNGTPGPYLDVTTERVRLRVLNASNARIYNFAFADQRSFDLVGTDGGLLPAPASLTHLELSPGERAELVVEMAPGETTELQSRPLASTGNRFAGADDSLDVLQLRAADTLRPSPDVPDSLAPAPDVSRADVVETRELRLSGTSINGRDMDMVRIDQAVRAGTTELWRVRNADGNPHNIHLHGVSFAVASVDGRPPPSELTGWKDTLFLPESREVELLVRFEEYADPSSPYMYHCHLLRHEDSGMMGQFVVLDEGEQPGEVGDEHQH